MEMVQLLDLDTVAVIVLGEVVGGGISAASSFFFSVTSTHYIDKDFGIELTERKNYKWTIEQRKMKRGY